MKINEVLKHINATQVELPDCMSEFEVLNICHNSRLADSGSIFVCKKGALADGHTYAINAYEQGTRCFIAERDLNLPSDAAVITVKDANTELCKLAEAFYDHPAHKLKIVGITGTKGKTTVALSIYGILTSAGINAGYIGTNGAYYGGNVHATSNTTPDCLELQRIFSEMVKCRVSIAVIEVSSQALWQNRIFGIEFDTCIFTNLYEDHIGGYEHPNFEHYRNCKKLLFTQYKVKNVIVNFDCPDWRYMINGSDFKSLTTTSAKGNVNADYFATDKLKLINGKIPGVSFALNYACDGSDTALKTVDAFIPIPGEYSIENGLLTIAACIKLGIKDNEVIKHLSRISISGRFESVLLNSRPNSLFVIDYAHNGASLRAVLQSMREYSPNRIICLFGSVGGRTYGRRQELAEAAMDLADVIIVTSDNPGTEDPQHVVDDIGRHLIDCKAEVHLISDRANAIRKAYELADDGDFVLLAGKGHETYQLIGNEKIPFSERKILLELDNCNAFIQ